MDCLKNNDIFCWIFLHIFDMYNVYCKKIAANHNLFELYLWIILNSVVFQLDWNSMTKQRWHDNNICVNQQQELYRNNKKQKKKQQHIMNYSKINRYIGFYIFTIVLLEKYYFSLTQCQQNRLFVPLFIKF